MSSLAERRRNNVRAGIFVTFVILLAVAVILILSDISDVLGAPRNEYTVTYSVTEGVRNLQTGAAVRVGGLQMGRVNQVRMRSPDSFGGHFGEVIEVKFALDRRIGLYDNATVVVTAPLIGSDAWLEIVSLGGPSVAARQSREGLELMPALLANGGELVGYAGAGAVDTFLGPRGAEIVGSLANVLANIERDYNADIGPSLHDLREMIADIRNDRWPHWAQSIDRLMSWAVEATTNLDAAIADGHGTITDIRGAIADNRPHIDTIVSNAETLSADAAQVALEVRQRTQPLLDRVQSVADTAQSGLDEAVTALKRIRSDYEGWETRLDDALGNAALTAQQLKLASIEVRRSPWKLLYRPEPDELQHELLYDSVRAFALAVSDLKAASKSAQRILDRHSEQLEEDPAIVHRLRTDLIDSLNRYEKAQSRLFNILLADTPRR